MTATLTYDGASGPLGAQAVAIPSGPGLHTVYVNTHWSSVEHSTTVTAVGQDSGTPVRIVVERRMRWHGSLEGHSSTGQYVANLLWEFPEGGTGLFSTFIALFNPHTAAATVRLYYRHENGSVYYQDVGVPAQSRITVGSPGFLPAGAYATEIYGLTHAVNAERVVYAGTRLSRGAGQPDDADGHDDRSAPDAARLTHADATVPPAIGCMAGRATRRHQTRCRGWQRGRDIVAAQQSRTLRGHHASLFHPSPH